MEIKDDPLSRSPFFLLPILGTQFPPALISTGSLIHLLQTIDRTDFVRALNTALNCHF
jgi:hypothetical protein